MSVRVGFVGAGWWAVANHVPAVAADPRASLAGVCRLGARELEAVRARFGFPFATESFEELLDRCPMDALVVTTPHRMHAAQALAAIGRGLHVMVEKPLATDPAEARAVEAAARARGVHVLIPHGWNFKPFVATAKAWVEAGRIGRVTHVSGRMASPIGDLLSGEAMGGTESEMFRPDPAMWADPATGGFGWGQLIHLLGLLFHVAPLRAQSVFALTGAGPTGADLTDAVAVRFQGGATGSLSGVATMPPGSPYQVALDLVGTEGALSLSMAPAALSLVRHDGERDALPLAPDAGAYECLAPVARFVALCAGERVENAAPAACGARAVEVVAAMLASARSGRLEAVA